MTTAQYFHVPEMREMELRSHDCNDKRVYRQLRHLCTFDGWFSKLTTLHLVLQCSEQVVINVLKYLRLLQELILSIVHPSPSWQIFLESLAAIPYGTDWLDRNMRVRDPQEWRTWCSSRTWHVNLLPHLKHLGIQCPKGFSRSECLDICPLLRLIGWTRTQLTPPLEQLKVWEGRGTTEDIVIDYISAGYLEKYLGISGGEYDQVIVSGMITKCLFIDNGTVLAFQLHSTILFRQLQELVVNLDYSANHDIPILPYLEQIKRLEISGGIIPAYPLRTALPLTRTLQWLKLDSSTSFWMIGRSFEALREFEFAERPIEFQARPEGLEVDLPACTILKWVESQGFLRFPSSPNIRIFHFRRFLGLISVSGEACHKSLANFLCTCSCLQQLEIHLYFEGLRGAHSLIQFVLYNAREQGVWRDIRSVKVMVEFLPPLEGSLHPFFSETVGHQWYYEKWWEKVTVAKEGANLAIINAST